MSTRLWFTACSSSLIAACSLSNEPAYRVSGSDGPETGSGGAGAEVSGTGGTPVGATGGAPSGAGTAGSLASGGVAGGGAGGVALAGAAGSTSAGSISAGGAAGSTSAGGAAGSLSAGGAGGVGPAHCPAQPPDLIVPRGSGGSGPLGPLAPSTATRPQLTVEQADARFTALRALARGGAFVVAYTGAGGAAGGGNLAGAGGTSVGLGTPGLTFERNDDWDPLATGVGDVNRIVPAFVVAQDGSGTHLTLQAAIGEAVLQAGCPRVYIRMLPGVYRGKVVVPAKTSAPPVTVYSTESDASLTVIVGGSSAAGAEGSGTPMSISGSATFTQSLPSGFEAMNLTIANDYVEGTYPGDNQAAVALLNQGDRASYENVRVLGNRNSLYVKSTGTNQVSRTYFRECYVEGDDEIVLGRGTAVFDRCEIRSLGSRVPTGGIIGAPSTVLANPVGLLFIGSSFTADASASGVFLGRQWMESDQLTSIGKMVVRDSTLGAHVRLVEPWAPSPVRATPKEPAPAAPFVVYGSEDYYPAGEGLTPAESYLAECGNAGPGAATAP